MRLLRDLWDGLRALLFPRHAACTLCASPLEPETSDVLCSECLLALQRAKPPVMPAFVPRPLDFWACAVPFGGVTRELIHRYKYGGLTYLAPFMADAMVACIPESVDLIVPIPLHPKRERARGFNQSRTLAQHLSARCGIPCEDALIRIRFTHQQAKLTHRHRRKNLQNAMKALPCVRGKRILIIDDVLTTGSTALEAARALRVEGAAWVGVLTYAKA